MSDLNASTEFYRAAPAPLGHEVLMDFDFGVGLEQHGKPDLWLYPSKPKRVQTRVAVAAPDRRTADAFHAAALQAGGQDTGSPRVSPEHAPPEPLRRLRRRPDGHNLVAACHPPH